jgi:DNA polymerase III subunit delta
MPKASPEKFIGGLAQAKPVPAVVLLGSDSYLLDLCRKKIIDTYVPEGLRDWAVFRISAREAGWEEVLSRAQMLPMLAERQVLVVEDAASLERLGEKARQAALEALGQYFASPAPFTVLVLEADELDGRQKFYKLLSEEALIVELTIGRESAAALAERMAVERGAKIDRAAAGVLADFVNGEPARLSLEIEKLAAYANGATISEKDVEKLVVSERKNTVWQLADMLAGRRHDAAFGFLENLLREGEQPIMIVGALARLYRQLVEAREMPPTANKFQVAQRLHIPFEAAENILRAAHGMPRKKLLAALEVLAEADSRLKSSNPNPRAVLEFLLVQL